MTSTTPYLGSKISLVSKAKIRYEGILYTIDTQESTVALAKVRSLGTEDRPTDRPVPARDEVYEYIIFRGSDIEDLHVCEPYSAQKQQSSYINQDPAIVKTSVSAVYPVAQPTSSMPAMPTMSAMPIITSNNTVPSATKTTMSSSNNIQSSEKSSSNQKRSSPTQDSSVQVDSTSQDKSHQQQLQSQRLSSNKEVTSRRQNQESQSNTEFNMNRLSYNNQPLHQRSNFNNDYNNRQYNNDYNDQQPRNRMVGSTSSYTNQNSSYNQNANQRRNNGQSNVVGSQRNNQQRNQYNNSPRLDQRSSNTESRRQRQNNSTSVNNTSRTTVEPLKFEGEFNFEEANARFEQEIEKEFSDKLKISGSKTESDLLTSQLDSLQQLQQDQTHMLMKQKVLDSDNGKHHHYESEEIKSCYDKSSSFFDSISCEASDKTQARPKNWKEERKTNVETFGIVLRQHNGPRNFNNYRGNQSNYNNNYPRRNNNGNNNQQYRVNNNVQQRYNGQQQQQQQFRAPSNNQMRNGNNGYNNSMNQSYRQRVVMEVGGNDGFQQRNNSGYRRYNAGSR